MKKLSKLKIYALQILCLLFPVCVQAQQLFTQTISATPASPYSNPLGVEILPNSTVTITGPGTVVTFMYDVTVDATAKLIVQNGATIKMGNDKRIILNHYNTANPPPGAMGARLLLNNNAVITSLTSSVTGNLWRGIECTANATAMGIVMAGIKINNGTLQYASCAYTNTNPL